MELEYEELINPKNLFTCVEEVVEFLKLPASVSELEAFLYRCEREELYEYCQLVKKEIESKIKDSVFS